MKVPPAAAVTSSWSTITLFEGLLYYVSTFLRYPAYSGTLLSREIIWIKRSPKNDPSIQKWFRDGTLDCTTDIPPYEMQRMEGVTTKQGCEDQFKFLSYFWRFETPKFVQSISKTLKNSKMRSESKNRPTWIDKCTGATRKCYFYNWSEDRQYCKATRFFSVPLTPPHLEFVVKTNDWWRVTKTWQTPKELQTKTLINLLRASDKNGLGDQHEVLPLQTLSAGRFLLRPERLSYASSKSFLLSLTALFIHSYSMTFALSQGAKNVPQSFLECRRSKHLPMSTSNTSANHCSDRGRQLPEVRAGEVPPLEWTKSKRGNPSAVNGRLYLASTCFINRNWTRPVLFWKRYLKCETGTGTKATTLRRVNNNLLWVWLKKSKYEVVSGDESAVSTVLQWPCGLLFLYKRPSFCPTRTDKCYLTKNLNRSKMSFATIELCRVRRRESAESEPELIAPSPTPNLYSVISWICQSSSMFSYSS